MWVLLLGWWQKSYAAVFKWAGIAAAGLLVYFNIRQSGRNAARIEQLIAERKQIEEAHAIENDMQRLDNGTALDELRHDWQRKQ